MKILQLISSSSLFGAEMVAIELSKGLKYLYNCQSIIGIIENRLRQNIEVMKKAKEKGLEVVIFKCAGKLDISTVIQIKKFIKKNGINLIHCHGYKSNFYGLISTKKYIPSVTTNHNWLKNHWKLKIYCFLDGLWIRYFDRIVAVSNEIKKEMVKYRIPEKKIRIIDNGIDINRYNKKTETEKIKKELGFKDDERIVGTIGCLKKEKGYFYLLRAGKEIIDINKNVKFLIVGNGPLRNWLEDEADRLNIRKNIIFTGYRNDIPELLSAMDIFVLPSIREGLPIALLEAMASKTAVIATKVGAIPKVIQNEENGILLEPKDVNGLKDAIINLLNDNNKMQKLALQGYEKVKREFSSEIMCKRYFNIYKELL